VDRYAKQTTCQKDGNRKHAWYVTMAKNYFVFTLLCNYSSKAWSYRVHVSCNIKLQTLNSVTEDGNEFKYFYFGPQCHPLPLTVLTANRTSFHRSSLVRCGLSSTVCLIPCECIIFQSRNIVTSNMFAILGNELDGLRSWSDCDESSQSVNNKHRSNQHVTAVTTWQHCYCWCTGDKHFPSSDM